MLHSRKKGNKCRCEICKFVAEQSQEVVELSEINGDVMALMKDGSYILTPFFLRHGMAVN